MTSVFEPRSSDALLVIDVQPDFLPGGALAVPDGDAVLPVVEELVALFPKVYLTQDWHPAGHASFASSHADRAPFDVVDMPYGPQVLWPDHCVQGTPGARLAVSDEAVEKSISVIRKGTNPAIDSYSAFLENDGITDTGLADLARLDNVRRFVMVGLATDYCVAFSALDARRLGFDVAVYLPGCRGIDAAGVAKQIAVMRAAGIEVIED